MTNGRVLLAGGAGYIGSHIAVELIAKGYDVEIVDSFVTGLPTTISAVERITGRKVRTHVADIRDKAAMGKIFGKRNIDAVIHLAGFKAVGESVMYPLKYYSNNVGGTMVLAQMCLKYGVRTIVYSSSATVYGAGQSPMKETDKLPEAANPYGATKVMSERILSDAAAVNPELGVVLLRYFNPIGAHPSGLIGDFQKGPPANLLPYLVKVAAGELPALMVYGGDYPTDDGTCVRDYIHVQDLAEAHVAALKLEGRGAKAINIGTGKGTSVLQLIRAFELATGLEVPFVIEGRRAGDVAASYADVSKAFKLLGWSASRGLDEMCRDAWKFYSMKGVDVKA